MAVIYHSNLSTQWSSRRDRPTAPWLNSVAKQRATPHTIRWGWWQFINADIQRCPMRENDNVSLQSERLLTNRVHALPSVVVRKDRFLHFLRFKRGLKPRARYVARVYICATFFCCIFSTDYEHQLSDETGYVGLLGQRCRPSSMNFLA